MEKFFLIVAAVGGVLFLIKLVLMFMGTDHGGDDVGAVHSVDTGDSDVSFKLLSLQAITAFLLMFGLIGYAMMHQSKLSAAWATAGGTGAGVAAMVLVAWIFRFATKLQSSGTLNLDNAAGQEGTVYLRIPPGGTGKVQCLCQGRLVTLDATSEASEELKSGQRVKVLRVVNSTTVVVQKS